MHFVYGVGEVHCVTGGLFVEKPDFRSFGGAQGVTSNMATADDILYLCTTGNGVHIGASTLNIPG